MGPGKATLLLTDTWYEVGFKKEQEECARQGAEASPVKAQDVSSQGIIKNQRD